jgi:hypothetical protein
MFSYFGYTLDVDGNNINGMMAPIMLVVWALVAAVAILLQSYPPEPEPHYYSLMSYLAKSVSESSESFCASTKELEMPIPLAIINIDNTIII